jgi:glycosyltransferase involved in cell wall biosynthesis
MQRLLFFAGAYYYPPFDEGVKLVAYHLCQHLSRLTEVVLATTAEGAPEEANVVPNHPFGFARHVRRLCKAHRPEAVLYVPDAYLDRYTLARCGLLRLAAGGVPTGMVTLMPATVDLWVRGMTHFLRPDVVFPVTDSELDFYRRRGIRYRMLPPAIDVEKFRPVRDEAEKRALRRKYGLPEEGKICIHVGHFRKSRNIERLARLQMPDGTRLVVVGRRSRPGEDDMSQALLDRGAIILDSFLPDIQEVYQAADLYLFPVEEDRAAIAMPLSVLEAMACNLPVVSTPFGGLVRCFEGVEGVYFARTREEFQEAVARALAGPVSRTREAMEGHSWERAATDILAGLEECRWR